MTSKEPPNSHRIMVSLTIDQALGKELHELDKDLMWNTWLGRQRNAKVPIDPK